MKFLIPLTIIFAISSFSYFSQKEKLEDEFNSYKKESVLTNDLTLYSTTVKVIDAETGLGVTVLKVTNWKPKIKANRALMISVATEANQESLRYVWIDMKNSKPELIIKAQGYQDTPIPPEAINEFTEYVVDNTSIKPTIIKLKRITI